MKKCLSVALSLLLLLNPVNSCNAAAASATEGSLVGSAFGFLDDWKRMVNENPIIKTIGLIDFTMRSVSGIAHSVQGYWDFFRNCARKIKSKCAKVNQNMDEVIENFDKELDVIEGQDEAKQKMKEYLSSIIDARNEAKENKKPYGKGDVLYMIGASGVGKTFSADCLAKAIMGNSDDAIRIDSSCFEASPHMSVKSQLLYMRTKQNNKNNMNYYMDNSLAAQIASNPKRVLILDEYDKWGTPAVDEFLRTIMDKGVIYRDGEKIDCSEILVLVLSNEDSSSVTAGNNMGVFKDDGTGSRTHVKHDKSFLNRLKIIEFKNLATDAYEKIAQRQLKQITERYKEKYNINLDLGETAKKIAIRTEKVNQGAREIEKILAKLKTAIITRRQQLKNTSEITFSVEYDVENDEFTLKLLDESLQKKNEINNENQQNINSDDKSEVAPVVFDNNNDKDLKKEISQDVSNAIVETNSNSDDLNLDEELSQKGEYSQEIQDEVVLEVDDTVDNEILASNEEFECDDVDLRNYDEYQENIDDSEKLPFLGSVA